jgi:hypothetical protein
MRRTISVGVAVVVLVAGGATVAAAKGPGKGKARAAKVQQQRTLMTAATAYLGLTRPVLAQELRSGKSLAQIATARGKSVDGLEQALVAALRAKIEARRAAGKIDAARAQRMSARAEQIVERIVNAVPKATKRPKAQRGVLGVAATYLGLTRSQLAAELRTGKSLAQVATARAKSVDGLESALLAPLKRKLDAAVASSRLDAAKAQRLLDRAAARIERLVNRTRT